MPPPYLSLPLRRVRSVKDGNKEEEIKEILVGGNSSTRTYYFRKCKRIRWSVAESIPDELLFEILVRLPAQDIYFGARLVCWKWYHMTRTKNFIHKHLEHASYGLLCMDASGDIVFISAREDGRGIDTCKLNYIVRNSVWSSCNGLMLEYDRKVEKIYYVTNVATDQAFRLPPHSCIPHPLEFTGIGYDVASMTYKVVVMYYESGQYRCSILTLGVDKSWRSVRIDHLSSLGVFMMQCHPIITEGFIHWNKYGRPEVVTLNLQTEIIAETPPPVVVEERTMSYCLSTGRYLHLFRRRGKLLWDVFEMKPKTAEWRKFANICLEGQKGKIERLGFNFKHDVDIKPCVWLKYPEVLALRIIVVDTERKRRVFIIFYNLITCDIGAEKLCICWNYARVTPHKNSLVWLGGPS